jgi:hypothetical protein
MARMLPERLPEGLASDAEYDLFAAFANELDERYTVLAGVKWLTTGRRQAFEGEADFVIAHPERGLLVMEAKGGQISIDGATGQWSSVDRHGTRHTIKDPAEQAQRNCHSLRAKLEEAPASAQFRWEVGYAVALPDVRLRSTALGPGLPAQVVLDSDAYGNMQASIERIFAHTLGERQAPIGSAGIQALIDVLRPSWELQVALRAELRKERERFHTLTEQQSFVLDFLAGHRRALIDGCAGSGKTFLAVEKARRLASEGFDTLLTCFNKHLADWMRASIDPLPANLRVQNFHALAHELILKAGGTYTVPSGDRTRFFKEDVPTALFDLLGAFTTRFDAVIVDEGQDFEDEWWMPLLALLRSEETGICYIFYDSQQSIYTSGPTLPLDTQPHFLSRNLRNTQSIHRAFAAHYGDRQVECSGPEGRHPLHLNVADPGDALRKQLHRLVVEEGVPTEDIVVLTAASQARSRWKDHQRLGNLTLRWTLTPGHGEIAVSTIHSFKGLERPVAIVTELEKRSHPQHREQLELVAFSRASSELITISEAATPVPQA